MQMLSLETTPPLAQTVIEENLYGLETRGYSLVEGFLPLVACDLLKQALVQALEEYTPAGSERSHLDRYLIHDLLARQALFGQLIEDPRLQQLVAPLLGPHWIMYAFTSSSLPPGESNYGARVHVDSPRSFNPHVFNLGLMWALDGFTKENGGTFLLPGSQNSSNTPDAAYFERNCIQIECPKGSVVVFNARVFHRAGHNSTREWRHALTMNACRSFMKPRLDWVRLIPKALLDSLGPQARRLVGFDTRLPTSMEEFFLPDEQRLYKPDQG